MAQHIQWRGINIFCLLNCVPVRAVSKDFDLFMVKINKLVNNSLEVYNFGSLSISGCRLSACTY